MDEASLPLHANHASQPLAGPGHAVCSAPSHPPDVARYLYPNSVDHLSSSPSQLLSSPSVSLPTEEGLPLKRMMDRSSFGVLLSIGGAAGPAQLFLLCGGVNETVTWVQGGDFRLAFAKRAESPLTMLTCEVGDHQWLLARDSPVLRVGPRKFTFAFPGFFYALALPQGCFDEAVRRLEVVLVMLCTYVNHAGERDSDFCERRPETNFWASAYTKIKRLSVKPPPLPFPRGPTGPPGYTLWTLEQATLKFERAMRTSAATKLLGKILLEPLDLVHHVEVVGPLAAAVAASRGEGPYIFASLRMVLDVVDAVEAANGIGTGNWTMAPDSWAAPPDGTIYWHFNIDGLMWILRCVSKVDERDKANESVALPGGGGRAAAAAEAGASSSFSPGGQVSGNASTSQNGNHVGGSNGSS